MIKFLYKLLKSIKYELQFCVIEFLVKFISQDKLEEFVAETLWKFKRDKSRYSKIGKTIFKTAEEEFDFFWKFFKPKTRKLFEPHKEYILKILKEKRIEEGIDKGE
jgi:hypothetical protein